MMGDELPRKPLALHSDGHIHTKYCHHAKGEMEQYVQQGIARGLQEIVFLEHMEAGVRYFECTWLTEPDFDQYFAEGKRLQEKYRDLIRVSLGVELGYSPTHKEELRQRLSERTWDRIGISYHFMPRSPQSYHLNLMSRKERNILAITEAGCDNILSEYYETLTEAVLFLPGTVLCHLDAALRFQPKVTLRRSHRAQIHELLKTVQGKGMALEVNTSGFTIRGTPFPEPFILKEAMALRIPLRPGSDAHCPADVGRHFKRLPEYLDGLVSASTLPG